MTGKLSSMLFVALLTLGAFALTQAQAQPVPPGGGNKPAGGEAKPDAKPDDKKPPEKFHSPFNGDKEPDSQEARDFGSLLDLYDAMLDAQAALAAAEKCNGDTKKAKEDLDKATAAFNQAFDEYVIGWDMGSGSMTLNAYAKIVKDHSKPYMKGKKAQQTMDALKAADKKKHDAAACPPPTETPVQPGPSGTPAKPLPGDTAPEHSSLPPCDDGSDQLAARITTDEDALAQVLAREGSATGEALDALKASEASFRDELAALSALKACPSDYHAPEEDGGGPSVTIGIGIGVGGDDRHHDDHKPRGGHCDAAARRDHAPYP